MPVEKVRFDEVDEADPPDWEYHGYYLTYTEPGYLLHARIYDDEPEELILGVIPDAPRRGFGQEIPYGDSRLARAAVELLAQFPATRLVTVDRGPDATRAEVDLSRLVAEGHKAAD